MLVSMVKDFLEDKRRRAADEIENCRMTSMAELNQSGHSLSAGKKEQLVENLLD